MNRQILIKKRTNNDKNSEQIELDIPWHSRLQIPWHSRLQIVSEEEKANRDVEIQCTNELINDGLKENKTTKDTNVMVKTDLEVKGRNIVNLKTVDKTVVSTVVNTVEKTVSDSEVVRGEATVNVHHND